MRPRACAAGEENLRTQPAIRSWGRQAPFHVGGTRRQQRPAPVEDGSVVRHPEPVECGFLDSGQVTDLRLRQVWNEMSPLFTASSALETFVSRTASPDTGSTIYVPTPLY